jgi:hypothetical protein
MAFRRDRVTIVLLNIGAITASCAYLARIADFASNRFTSTLFDYWTTTLAVIFG